MTLTKSAKFTILVQTGIPVLLKGMPGEGKTAHITALARACKRHLETVIASIRDASEIGGLPMQTKDGIVLNPPKWAVNLSKSSAPLAFFDEITCVMPAVQAALLRVILEKVVGDITLPENTWIVAAANPPEVAANGWDLSPPMANRFAHMEWELDYEDWADGMVNGFQDPEVLVLPSDWRDKIPEARAMISTFIRKRPHLLRVFPKADADKSGPWPSPRSWTMAATVYAAALSIGADPVDLVASCVGNGAAVELGTYIKNIDLPNPAQVLADVESVQWPGKDRDDKLFAITSSVIAYVASKKDPILWEKSLYVIDKVITLGKKDIAVVGMMQLMKCQPPGVKKSGVYSKVFASLFDIMDAAGQIKPEKRIKR